jgi:endonuclease/exonuclease/phosphatase family metal-dependent hydrolase
VGAMATIDDPRPSDVRDELTALTDALDQVVPARTGANLLIGTWNVRAFSRLRPAWRSTPGDSPIRDLSNACCIAEVVRRFDVTAIQEVRNPDGLLGMMRALGPSWAFVVTDVTEGSRGNAERLAFVFDRDRVSLSGLACELVVAPEEQGVPEGAMTEQFARTPYAVGFSAGGRRFTLVTLHVLYGDDAADRVPELTAIARWLERWAGKDDPWSDNLIALGDFNIDRAGDPLHQAFTSTGLAAPENLNLVPRTIFDDPDPTAPSDRRHFYDQIAWFPSGRGKLSMAEENSGMFDFTDGDIIPAVSRSQLSYRISDHYPLWCELV